MIMEINYQNSNNRRVCKIVEIDEKKISVNKMKEDWFDFVYCF